MTKDCVRKAYYVFTPSGIRAEANPDSSRAAASALKPALMIAFLKKYSSILGQPLTNNRGLQTIFSNGPYASLPNDAWYSFRALENNQPSLDRATVQQLADGIGNWTPEELAEAMMRPNSSVITSLAAGVSSSIDPNKERFENRVYNTATNIAISAFGGEAGASTAIKNLGFDDADKIIIRRYMLDSRGDDLWDDNTATAKALAKMMEFINCYQGDVGIAAKNALSDTPENGFSKRGDLKSNPLISARAGLKQIGGTQVYYGFMYTVDQSNLANQVRDEMNELTSSP